MPRLPDKLRHYLEAPMGFVMGMVIDSAEYGSADGPESPAQLVRDGWASLSCMREREEESRGKSPFHESFFTFYRHVTVF